MQLNNQPISKRVRAFDGTYQVHSIFYTIQGEGPFCGQPAVFVRLAGCNLQCPWCDTEYTEGARAMAIHEIIATVIKLSRGVANLIVITGGEPFRQPIGELIYQIVARQWRVQIETNGTLPIDDQYGYLYTKDLAADRGAFIVCSPKTGVVDKTVAALACCYKYVVDIDDGVGSDGLPNKALGHTANPRLARPPVAYRGPIYIQPADHKDPARNQANIELAAACAMDHNYTVQLQIHKYLGVE